MKSAASLFLFLFAFSSFAQQKETFDLTTYVPPADWKKEVKETLISYTLTDNKKGTWCQLSIIKSTISKGSLEADFKSEWNEFAVKNYGVKDAPQTTEVEEADGWRVKSGAGKFTFNNADASVLLTTASGYERCASIIAITNSSDYMPHIQRFLESVDLIKPKITSASQAENSQTGINNNVSIVGTWTVVRSDQDSYLVNNGVAGYIRRQYTFNQNGTYRNVIKTFSFFADILLTKESGTYQVSGNNITITPQKCVMEAWSKKDNADKWGKRLSSQNRTLEKATYQFSIEYNDYIKETQLIIQASNATQRDGPFDRDNQWFYKLPTNDYDLIKLPD